MLLETTNEKKIENDNVHSFENPCQETNNFFNVKKQVKKKLIIIL